MTKDRRSDFDVTNTVQVSDPRAVAEAVIELFAETYPGEEFPALQRAFVDFARLFRGEYPGFLGCDTVYHDMQHSLDNVLAMARLIAGHDRSQPEQERLGPQRATIGVITALFHDAGYIREESDRVHRNGAEFTLFHVTRSAEFLAKYLRQIGLEEAVPVATRIVHFTGFEVRFDQIQFQDEKNLVLGHLLGTADLMAQTADRCYLEKCRDRLYPEFVLAGIALRKEPDGTLYVKYDSGRDVLRQTPLYYANITRRRLDEDFRRSYRYIEVLYDGANPYMDVIDTSLEHLERILQDENWELLRRDPPCFTATENALTNIERLVEDHLRQLRH